MTTLTYATTSSAYTYTVGTGVVQQTWLDGSGRVFNYSTSSKKGRYLAGYVARNGFGKTTK
jgi:hypothetical protein